MSGVYTAASSIHSFFIHLRLLTPSSKPRPRPNNTAQPKE